MCGGTPLEIGAMNLAAIEEALRMQELIRNLALALLETSRISSTQDRSLAICKKASGLDRALLERAIAETAHYRSVQDQAIKIIEILKKGRRPVLEIKIKDPTRP
ncbi:hypothetical protein A2Z53_02280 [Candidatus Giovannonibacteria bacterium RIFCSPHIGHO2_02_42_15]|uniref:Uncharacterized protein n=2 Tax=Candidatus Giovannoniibacteriota TaxID=1752738 RepID=A0A1F5VK41_9BACT|nr:MAG: hypothetical protein UV11_C0035G0028 [Candidatus Giovannonibacteria bacterium GW2011_GWF2_42_19]OGF63802.1 MAG: hypothetical protein A2Z53_02280 [Candidatus Giovannonibacteria bacterium RIFCSPHIGHO2_02_42_15]